MENALVRNHPNNYRPVPLERVFNIRDDAFNEYMSIMSLNDTSADDLHCLSERMGRSSEPVVKYAAGWAALEEASVIGQIVPLPSRVLALERAQQIWTQARDDLYLLRNRSGPEDPVRDNAFGLALRAQFALKSMPAARAAVLRIVEWDDDKTLVIDEMAMAHKHLLRFGADLRPRGLEKKDKGTVRTRMGVCYEVLSLLMLQRYGDTMEIVLPSSLREDHNINPAHRGDLQILSFGSSHPQRTLAQITSDNDKRMGNTMLTVHTRSDILVDNDPIATIKLLAAEASDEELPLARASKLDRLRDNLHRRLSKLRRRNQKYNIQL